MNKLERLLQRKMKSGVYLLTTELLPSEILAKATNYGFTCYYVNGRDIVDSADFVLEMQANIRCPYFGGGWDALLDCLRDLAWHSADGFVLLFDSFDNFATKDEGSFSIAVSVLKDTGDFWNTVMQNNPPMYILLKGNHSLIPDPTSLEVLDF